MDTTRLPAIELCKILTHDTVSINIISSFLRNTSDRLLRLEIYLDLKQVNESLQTLVAVRTSATMIGANALAETCRHFIRHIKKKGAANYKKNLDQLYNEYSRLAHLLRQHGILQEDG